MAQVLALAPDEAGRKAARALARPRPWSDLGSTDSLVWGKCQGSAKAPYQVTVDLNEPAFRCTCPSRKFPCKHGVALLLLWADADSKVAELGAAAPFADEWVGERRIRAEQRADRAARQAAGESGLADPEAAARRAEQRQATMTAGLEDFERWLTDLVRQGLAEARRQPYRYWDAAAARLVDAQLPALADRVRGAAGLAQGGGDWAERLLAELGRWFLAVRAWPRRAALPPAVAADLETFLGASRRKEDVEAAGGVRDRWHVVGVRLGEDERIRSQRTWLIGEDTGEFVVLLDFAAAGAVLQVPGVVGSIVDATVARYPGHPPVRGLFTGDQLVVGTGRSLPHAADVATALDRAATWLASNPWLGRVPVALRSATAVIDDGDLWVVDDTGRGLQADGETDPWLLLALTGGHPTEVFGELQGGRLHVTTVAVEGALVGL